MNVNIIVIFINQHMYFSGDLHDFVSVHLPSSSRWSTLVTRWQLPDRDVVVVVVVQGVLVQGGLLLSQGGSCQTGAGE